MAGQNVSGDGQQKTFGDLTCSPDLTPGLHGQLTFILVLNSFMSVTCSISWECFHPNCSSQGVLTSSAVQTLAS